MPLLDRLEPDLIATKGLCDVCTVTGREVHQADSLEALAEVLRDE